VTELWGLIPKKAISQFFQVRYHLKALIVLVSNDDQTCLYICGFSYNIEENVCGKSDILRNTCCFPNNTCRYMQILWRCTSKSCY